MPDNFFVLAQSEMHGRHAGLVVLVDSLGHYDRRALSEDDQVEQIYVLRKREFEQSNQTDFSR